MGEKKCVHEEKTGRRKTGNAAPRGMGGFRTKRKKGNLQNLGTQWWK